MIDAVNNPVGSDYDFADSGNAILGDNSAELGKVLQLVTLCDEAIGERSARRGLSREMNVTMSRRSSRAAGDQVSL
jgi:hypothetical protein